MENKIISIPDVSIVRLETVTHALQLPNETVNKKCVRFKMYAIFQLCELNIIGITSNIMVCVHSHLYIDKYIC